VVDGEPARPGSAPACYCQRLKDGSKRNQPDGEVRIGIADRIGIGRGLLLVSGFHIPESSVTETPRSFGRRIHSPARKQGRGPIAGTQQIPGQGPASLLGLIAGTFTTRPSGQLPQRPGSDQDPQVDSRRVVWWCQEAQRARPYVVAIRTRWPSARSSCGLRLQQGVHRGAMTTSSRLNVSPSTVVIRFVAASSGLLAARSARYSAPLAHPQSRSMCTRTADTKHAREAESASTTFSPSCAAPRRRCHRSPRPWPTRAAERGQAGLSSRLWAEQQPPGRLWRPERSPSSRAPYTGGQSSGAPGGVVVMPAVGLG